MNIAGSDKEILFIKVTHSKLNSTIYTLRPLLCISDDVHPPPKPVALAEMRRTAGILRQQLPGIILGNMVHPL